MTGSTGGTIEKPALITPEVLRAWKLPEPGGSKYSRGQVLVIGGAAATPGAVMLAGTAALRMGAGRLALAVDAAVAPHVAVAMPESGVSGLDDERSMAGEASGADAVLVGPGLGDADVACELLERVVALVGDDTPIVLDAYGATVLPDVSKSCRTALAGRLLATPNQGELAQLVGADQLADNEIAAAADTVRGTYDATVAAGGWVIAADGAWRSTSGDTGLGTSGSGDVLAGAVTGLLARGAVQAQAMVWAVHTHSAAGDVLAGRLGRVGYLAHELTAELPLVLGSLRGD